MRLADLTKAGIPERIIDIWRKRQGELLLPVQAKAVRKGLLGQAGNQSDPKPLRMLISAPTSSGKSFCAEMAMVNALTRRRKAVMLAPLKALAEQLYRRLERSYGPLGVRCLIVTGDHPENDSRFAGGEFHLAVAIYEKFDLLLTSNLDMLKNIGLVIVDEIQTIAEPGRGALLERLLTRMKASVYEPSLLCLSAVIGDASRSAGSLARWLDAELVEETARPVDLMRGVAAGGTWRYRSYNSGLDGSEPFESPGVDEQPFDAFIRQIKADGGSTLAFLKSRRNTVECAFRLAAGVNWPEATTALHGLEEEEPSFLVRSLRQVLSRGVAFHNADLSSRQRAVIEEAFAGGEIKVIFSTTTLALGVDLPADTVYLETVKYSSGEYTTRPSLAPVTRAEFDNMTGRAGRLRHGRPRPGRAIVLAESEFERDILWENYIAPDQPESITSAFATMPADDWLLSMVAGGLVVDLDSAARVFGQTFAAACAGNGSPPEFGACLEQLAERGLIESVNGSDRWAVTSLGRAAAQSGLSVEQADFLRRRLSSDRPQAPAGWLALALSAPGWSLSPGT
ncbi:MAG: DEAD/DEAH box helicase, partial [Candidatus Zixiibacteriota bacterium]